jgi:putative nucleotidyltransferase with HDIG domain
LLELLFPEDDQLTKLLLRIGRLADRYELRVFLVGGVVRDRIMGIPSKDIDIVVLGAGIDFAHKIAHSFRLKRILEYPRFGTAMIPYHEMLIEVATARSEIYETHSRKPIVSPDDIQADLLRRDFTINALAMSLNAETQFQLIDEFGGLKDLDAGIIRTPRDHEITFSEDPLRMLRAIRFASQLGFKIEKNTFQAIKTHRERLGIVSQERITDEFKKILVQSKRPSLGFQLLSDSRLLELVLPELEDLKGTMEIDGHQHKNIFKHSLMVLDNISEWCPGLELRFTALLHDIGKPATKRFQEAKGWTFHGHEEVGARMIQAIGKRMKLPNQLIAYAAKLTRLHLRPIAIANEGVTDSAVRRLIVEAGDQLADLIMLCRADITSKNLRKVREYMENFDRVMKLITEVQEKDRLRAFQSPIRGEEIMSFFQLKPSPAVGIIKKAIEEAILQGEIPNTHEAAREYLESKAEFFRRNLAEIDES